MNTTERSIPSGRVNLAAWDAGAGPLVVFLHAGVADSRMWTAQCTALADAHRTVAYDRRGFGRTGHADEDYSQVGDLLEVIRDCGGSPAILVGCSQGGRVALDAALAYPDQVRALVLIAPAISGAPSVQYPAAIATIIEKLDEAESAGDLDLVNDLEAQLWLDGPTSPFGRVPGTARALFKDMNGLALRAETLGNAIEPKSPAYPRLSEIGVPTLVIWGDLDFPHIQVRSETIARSIPGARSEAISGVAHLPSLETPELATDAIRGFIGTLV